MSAPSPKSAECSVPEIRARHHVLPKSTEAQAIAYTLNNGEALNRYADDGALSIDNNAAERSRRGVAVGRRNWTFFGSDTGGRTAAALKSFIATCQQANLDPWSYLVDVLKRIGDYPMNALDELLPNNWKPAEA